MTLLETTNYTQCEKITKKKKTVNNKNRSSFSFGKVVTVFTNQTLTAERDSHRDVVGSMSNIFE